MPKRPARKVSRPRKLVQQPLFVEPEALGRVLRRVYPDFMRVVDRVIVAADSPLCPSPVWAAVQELDEFTGRAAKRSSRCRDGRRKAKKPHRAPETEPSKKTTSHLLAGYPTCPVGPVHRPDLLHPEGCDCMTCRACQGTCVGCGLVPPDCTCS